MKKIIYYIFLVFTLMNSKISYSQNPNYLIDSSYQFIADKYYKYKFIDTLKSRNLVEIFLKKANKEKDTINIIDGYYFLGEVYNDDKIYLSFLDSLIEKTTKKPNKMFPAYLYAQKGGYELNNYNINESLKNYISAIKYAKKYKNDSIKYIINQKIAILKFRNKNFTESKKLNLKAYTFYKENQKFINRNEYNSLLSNISSNYLKEKKYDSAIFFNNKSSEFALKNNFLVFIPYSLYRKGQIEFKQEKYHLAIKNFKASIPGIIKDENYYILSESYNLIAKSYYKLNNYNEALKYNLLVDSLYNKKKITQKSQRSSYNFLINHYKEKKDLKNQLKYIEKFLKVDSILNLKDKNLAKTFSDEYDTPKLVAAKEKLIHELKDNIITTKKISIFLTLLVLIAFSLFIYQYKKKKDLKHRFNNFIKSQEKKVNKISKPVKITSNEIDIPKLVVNDIIIKLNLFEEHKEFKERNINLSSLALKLDTNTNYLSKTINHYKKKNFANYLNDLRINYAITLLNNNILVRKYTIKAIANEVGFNTAESFSNAFFKKTGLKPSFYIKQLEKLKIA